MTGGAALTAWPCSKIHVAGTACADRRSRAASTWPTTGSPSMRTWASTWTSFSSYSSPSSSSPSRACSCSRRTSTRGHGASSSLSTRSWPSTRGGRQRCGRRGDRCRGGGGDQLLALLAVDVQGLDGSALAVGVDVADDGIAVDADLGINAGRSATRRTSRRSPTSLNSLRHRPCIHGDRLWLRYHRGLGVRRYSVLIRFIDARWQARRPGQRQSRQPIA